MEHSFNTDLAKEIGIVPTILLKHIYFWVEKTEPMGKTSMTAKHGPIIRSKLLKSFSHILPSSKSDMRWRN
ncbi:MAG: hypothetical protein L6W00_12205 [Lentisphaeria bacterium]|nr:MAG: hypothetical protein L6W00_12205 [Lentisphaeria bacterium]